MSTRLAPPPQAWAWNGDWKKLGPVVLPAEGTCHDSEGGDDLERNGDVGEGAGGDAAGSAREVDGDTKRGAKRRDQVSPASSQRN